MRGARRSCSTGAPHLKPPGRRRRRGSTRTCGTHPCPHQATLLRPVLDSRETIGKGYLPLVSRGFSKLTFSSWASPNYHPQECLLVITVISPLLLIFFSFFNHLASEKSFVPLLLSFLHLTHAQAIVPVRPPAPATVARRRPFARLHMPPPPSLFSPACTRCHHLWSSPRMRALCWPAALSSSSDLPLTCRRRPPTVVAAPGEQAAGAPAIDGARVCRPRAPPPPPRRAHARRGYRRRRPGSGEQAPGTAGRVRARRSCHRCRRARVSRPRGPAPGAAATNALEPGERRSGRPVFAPEGAGEWKEQGHQCIFPCLIFGKRKGNESKEGKWQSKQGGVLVSGNCTKPTTRVAT